MAMVARQLKQLSLGPGDVRRNAWLGFRLLVLGGLPCVATYLSLLFLEYDGAGYPTSPVFLLLLAACLIAIPLLFLGLLATSLALLSGVFWLSQERPRS